MLWSSSRRTRRTRTSGILEGMRRPDLTDLSVVGAAVAVAVAVSPHDSAYWGSVLFVSVLLTLLGLVVRLGIETARAAVAQRRVLRELGVVDPREVACQAVLIERARLSSDLDASIRQALERVSTELGGLRADADPRPRARRIQAHAREASSELRRQLGLLRSAQAEGVEDAGETAGQRVAAGKDVVCETRPDRPDRPDLQDLLVGGAVTLLAATEGIAARLSAPAGQELGWIGFGLTLLAAFTLAGRRTRALPAALACAGVIGLGWLLPGVGVASGAWMVGTLGGLGWTLAAARPRVATIGTFLLLALVVIASRVTEDPENAGILMAILLVAGGVGALVGRNRRHHRAAATQAATLQAGLDRARDHAVRAERLATARELHDVVSHAVGVIATQAAAAELSWPTAPETARRALDTIAAVVEGALVEVERMPAQLPDTAHDLAALVNRIRSAGVSVSLRADRLPAAVEVVVYRVVQESLTNAVRHAPGSAVDVRVVHADGHVAVRVADDGPGPAAAGATSGFGLAGLDERVALAGGSLRAGAQPGGGFVVEANLPVPLQVSEEVEA